MQNANSVDLHDYLQAAYVAAGFANATNVNFVEQTHPQKGPSAPLRSYPPSTRGIHHIQISILAVYLSI